MSTFATARLNAIIQQRPVGQGGLCSGQLQTVSHRLNWVYDCGSNQTDSLAKEVHRLPERIDLLFISHLDDDHVSGLDRLLISRSIGEIVLPYLTDEARLMIVGSGASRGRLSSTLLDLIEDPIDWFRSRGVERVVFVDWPDENRDDDAEDDSRLPREPRPPENGPLKPEWSPPARRRRSSGDAYCVPADAAVQIATSASASSGGSAWVLDYVFLPHVHPPRPALVKAFAAEVAKRFPQHTLKQIVQGVRRPGEREQLRRCYEAIWSDHNLISMSLYAGPTGRGGSWRSCSDHFRHWSTDAFGAGWISTGDASFKAAIRRRAFARSYSVVADQVGVFVVPHHGAEPSWDPAVLLPFTRLSAGLAAAGPNGYGHPDPTVVADFTRFSTYFHQVSDEPSTMYQLTSWIA